jgi:hypothetical protein
MVCRRWLEVLDPQNWSKPFKIGYINGSEVPC